MIRLERLKVKEIRSQAKMIGTLLTFGGALVMATYKGPGFTIFHAPTQPQHHHQTNSSHNSHQTTGALYILMGCVALSAFYVLQVYISIYLYNCM